MARRSAIDGAKNLWVIVSEAVSSFSRNDNLTLASSLAFNTALALIPALFLLTSLLGAVIGSSQTALLKTERMLEQVIPRFSEVILAEVGKLSEHGRTLSLVNFLVLVWSITPLVSSMRKAFDTIFKPRSERSYVVGKLLDIVIVVTLTVGIAAIAVMGVALQYFRRVGGVAALPRLVESVAPLGLVILLILFLYRAFTPNVAVRHLLAGAVTAGVLWHAMRPAFNIFLVYNPGYGIAFGSFKSFFIIIIWIYYSQVVFLFGAEITSALNRREPILIKRLMAGKKIIPASGRSHLVFSCQKDHIVFREGDVGHEMYFVLKGSVGIRKGGREIAVIRPGRHFGEMSFLLAEPRTAAAVALEDSEFIVVDNHNIDELMREFPDYIRELLTEMARRLKATDELLP